MTTLRHLTLSVALAEHAAGVRETRPNWGPRVAEYLRGAGIQVPAPWCAAFVQWCSDRAAREIGVRNPLDGVVREALVADYVALGEDRGWVVGPDEADAGDLVCYRFSERWDHIGLVVEPPGARRTFHAVEGNTDDAGGREGIEVAIRTRYVRPERTLFLRWDEGEAFPRAMPDVPAPETEVVEWRSGT